MKPLHAAILAALSSSVAAASSVHADAIEEFYKGRNLTIIVGFSPGGAMDLDARLLARHVGMHLPGKPTVVVQNMPGAGGLTATNYVANAAPQDGTHFAIMLSTHTIEPLMGNKNARYDPAKFHWLGALTNDSPACLASRQSGITSIEQTREREITVGATGPSALTAQHPATLANLFGYRLKVITGYGGVAPIRMAMETGEVDAVCVIYASEAQGSLRPDLESGKLVPFVQMGPRKHPVFGDVPLVHDLGRNDEERAILRFVFGLAEISRPFAAPPGVPADRVGALREAFWAAANSPALKGDAERMNMLINQVSWEQTAAAYRGALEAPKEIVDLVRAVIRN